MGEVKLRRVIVARDIAPSAGDRDLVVSWIVPSRYFVLQQSPTLNSNDWTDVEAVPVFNPGSLRYEVELPATNSQNYYRLTSR